MADVVAEEEADVSDVLKLDDNVNETTNRNQMETGESSNNFGEAVEEEIMELEFEELKPKLSTHSMHCPNCKSEITKVILRRKVVAYQLAGAAPVDPWPGQKDIVRCFICSSLFTCSDDGCFKAFDVFRRRPETSIDHASPPENSTFLLSSNARGDDETTIIIENKAEPIAAAQYERSWLYYTGVLVEILKSIVYGGLMEVITSLSIVASAVASDVTTLSILSLALASLIGGVFIIGHNLWDLRDDCYKDGSSQETNRVAINKYKQLLGRVNYFPLHAFFAILSFLVFGMVPPVAYRYSYHESKDKDFALVVAATASLLCVSLLAILKAYINKCTVFEYFKTVVYYIIIALSVSGVSYVVGNLVTRLLNKLGWFDTAFGGGMPCLPRTINPFLETF